MAIDNSVYYQGGIRFGPVVENLAVGGDFFGTATFKDIGGGKGEFIAFLQPSIDKATNDIVTLFEMPKNYRADFSGMLGDFLNFADGNQNMHFFNPATYGVNGVKNAFTYNDSLVQAYVQSNVWSSTAMKAWVGSTLVIHWIVPITKK